MPYLVDIPEILPLLKKNGGGDLAEIGSVKEWREEKL